MSQTLKKYPVNLNKRYLRNLCLTLLRKIKKSVFLKTKELLRDKLNCLGDFINLIWFSAYLCTKKVWPRVNAKGSEKEGKES